MNSATAWTIVAGMFLGFVLAMAVMLTWLNTRHVEEMAKLGYQEVVVDRVTEVNAKWYDRANAFLLGMLFSAALVVGLVTTRRTQPLPEATENLHKAIHEFMESQRRETGDETVR